MIKVKFTLLKIIDYDEKNEEWKNGIVEEWKKRITLLKKG